jgi:hypothetical protein
MLGWESNRVLWVLFCLELFHTGVILHRKFSEDTFLVLTKGISQFLSGLQQIHHHWGISDRLVLFAGNMSVILFNILASAISLSFVMGLAVVLPIQTFGED